MMMTEIMLSILRKACEAILEVYADESRFNTSFKSDDSPLTRADQRSHDIIIEALEKNFPGIPVISEESKEDPYSSRIHYDQFFLVDPLDGTKEFIKRNGEFTINIALMEKNKPIAGFVFVPVTGQAYMAERGSGAFRIGPDNEKNEMRSLPFYLMDPQLKVVASRSHRDEETDKIISKLNQAEIVSTGSSLKFLLIAEGKAHFYPRLAPTMEWDTAAAQCILEEAGGTVARYDTLLPLIYNKDSLLNPNFLAFGALLNPESLESLFY